MLPGRDDRPGKGWKAVSEYIMVSADVLRAFACELLEKAGMPADEARMVADVQVDAELRGPNTHGVTNLQQYVYAMQEGKINPRPNIRVLKESPWHALVDGDRGMGQLISVKCMQICIAKAKETGLALVVARNSCHFGAARNYPMMALTEDLIAFCGTNAPPVMPQPGSSVAKLGNNPFSFVFPADQQFPVVLDMTCSVVALGKLRRAIDTGEKIPLDWGLDKEGRPTDDPKVAWESHLQPALGGYKGFGLALVMEVLAGVLGGGPIASEMPFHTPPLGVSHFFLVIDPRLFAGTQEFKRGMDGLIQQIKNAPLQDKAQKTYLPGERGFIDKKGKLLDGVPLLPRAVERLEQVGSELGVSIKIR